MKDGFKGFYTPNDVDLMSVWESENTIFVFDTNVFLNIYSYVEGTKEDLFSVLEIIKDKLWMPNHVALEYQKRRLGVIDRERENFSKITSVFNKLNNQINYDIIQDLGIEKKLPDLFVSLKSFLSEFNEIADRFKSGILEEQKRLKPDVRSGDSIRKRLDLIFSGKVGEPFSQDELNEIYAEGEVRFLNKIPPGFKDSGKGGDLIDFTYLGCDYKRKFGDLIIWKQLIKEASKDEVLNVVFVTDDKKSDWWYGVGSKTIGPQERLQTEFYTHTNVNNFKMYDTGDFLRDAAQYLDTKIDERSLDDVKQVSEPFDVNLSLIDESESIDDDKSKDNDVVGYDSSDNLGVGNKFNSEGEYLFTVDELNEYERERNESIMRGIPGYRSQEESIRRALAERDAQFEAIRRAADSGISGYRSQQESIRRALGVHDAQFEAIRRAADSGISGYRSKQESIRRALGEHDAQLEAIRRAADSGMSDYRSQQESIRRALGERDAQFEAIRRAADTGLSAYKIEQELNRPNLSYGDEGRSLENFKDAGNDSDSQQQLQKELDKKNDARSSDDEKE